MACVTVSLMLALTIGLLGVVLGWSLKTLSDLRAEQRAGRRADAIWRRERYVDAVADLAHSGRELMSANCAIARALFALSNAEQGGMVAIMNSCRAEYRAAIDQQLPWMTATVQALEVLRLYAPQNVVDRADGVWAAIHNDGALPQARDLESFEAAALRALSDLRAEARATAGLT